MKKAVILVLFAVLASAQTFRIDPKLLTYAQRHYGDAGEKRIENLVALMNEIQHDGEMQQLERVNRFFNALIYEADLKVWGVKDYWATRTEFLGREMGDCEDYVIAKYFTLRQLGFEPTRIFLTYVKALEYNQAHMVLTFFRDDAADPLVLDNINPEILPASKRRDLKPIINFNGEKVYLAKQRGLGRILPSGDVDIRQWKDLILKIRKETQ